MPPWPQGGSGEVRVAGEPLPCQAAAIQNTVSSRKKSVYRAFGGFTGLLKLAGSGGVDKDEKMRRITSAAGFGLCSTGNTELGSSCTSFASL